MRYGKGSNGQPVLVPEKLVIVGTNMVLWLVASSNPPLVITPLEDSFETTTNSMSPSKHCITFIALSQRGIQKDARWVGIEESTLS